MCICGLCAKNTIPKTLIKCKLRPCQFNHWYNICHQDIRKTKYSLFLNILVHISTEQSKMSNIWAESVNFRLIMFQSSYHFKHKPINIKYYTALVGLIMHICISGTSETLINTIFNLLLLNRYTLRGKF